MVLDIYEKVKEIIGVLPVELEFIYAICVILLFLIIIFVAVSPFVILYRLTR